MPRTNEPEEVSAEVRTLLPLIIAVKDDHRTWRRVVGTPQYSPQRDEFPTRDERISCLVRAPNPTSSERIIVPRSEWEGRLLLKDHDARYQVRYVYTAAEGLHMTYVKCECPSVVDGVALTSPKPCPRHPYLSEVK